MASIWNKLKILLTAKALSSRASTGDESHVCNRNFQNYNPSRARAGCGLWFTCRVVNWMGSRGGARLSWLPISVSCQSLCVFSFLFDQIYDKKQTWLPSGLRSRPSCPLSRFRLVPEPKTSLTSVTASLRTTVSAEQGQFVGHGSSSA